jgi:Trk K+ transport system NAD-binding subunit
MPMFDFGKLSSLIATVNGAMAGRLVREVEVDGKIRIAAIRRVQTVLVASPGEMLLEGDEINAIVSPDALSLFATTFLSAAPAAKLTA